MKKYAILIISTLLLIACKTEQEAIIFSSGRNGNSDIFIMYADGSNQVSLSQNPFEEWAPTWINEDEITFLRQENDAIKRIKLNLNTREESRLEMPSNCNLDDKNVLYSAANQYELYSCKDDIFLLDTKTDEIGNITEKINGKALYPSWSQDGKSLVYTSNHLGTNEVFLFDIESRETRQLTDSKANNERGELSPDGKFLLFSSDEFEKGNQEIVLKNLETGDLENISDSPGMELIARFSANGKNIYYGSNKDGNWEIYSCNLETRVHTQLTVNNEFDGDPRILKR
jgi:Tol biopolymer transport system component